MSSTYRAEAEAMLRNYFEGLYRGDVDLLRTVFHPDAVLIGDVTGTRTRRARDAYLEVVAQRKSPRALGQEIEARVEALNIVGELGSAVACVSMLGFHYTDFLNLIRHDGRWMIAHKLFTHSA